METTVLARSRSLTLHDVRCSATSRAAGDEELEPSFSVAIPVAGVYVRHAGGRRIVGAPGVALFMSAGDLYRTAHPAAHGDRSIELVLSSDTAEPFTAAPTESFREPVVRVAPNVELELRALARAAQRGGLSPLELDERSLGLIDGLLEAVTTGTLSPAQRAAVDRALEYLAWHFSDDADLPTVANEVGVSPHHLSRLFRAGTGLTLSGFRTELRIRAAMERIEQGACDLSAVACDVGFFDHAHMTRTFRRVLGRTPTQAREALRDR